MDARTLANLLRTGYLAEAWLAPKEVREQRLLLRERARLVRIRTSAKNRIRAQIADEGVPAPNHGLWTKDGAAFLEGLDLSPMHRWVVTDCRVLIEVLQSRITLVEAEIRRQAKPDKRVDALMAIPGIGLLSAMTLVSEIGGVTRFATARKLCAWAGIIPSMRNSDRTLHHGHITRAGPAAVRHVLAEAAQTAIRKEPYHSDFLATKRRQLDSGGRHHTRLGPPWTGAPDRPERGCVSLRRGVFDGSKAQPLSGGSASDEHLHTD